MSEPQKIEAVAGGLYVAKAGDREINVRLDYQTPRGVWVGRNLDTTAFVKVRDESALVRVLESHPAAKLLSVAE